ncbi:hypothetical protein EMCRGX_G014773 [Ephydatia muelleri]
MEGWGRGWRGGEEAGGGGEEAGGVGKRLDGFGRGWSGGKEAGGVGKRLEGWGRGWRGRKEAGGVEMRLEVWGRGWKGGEEDGRVGKRLVETQPEALPEQSMMRGPEVPDSTTGHDTEENVDPQLAEAHIQHDPLSLTPHCDPRTLFH